MKVEPTPFVPHSPEPLLRETPPGAPYPVAALGPVRDAVEAVQGMTQAPIAIPAQSALSVASLAAQAHADVETLGGTAPLSLYALTVAQSGERKSSCDRPLMEAVHRIEKEEAALWRDDMRLAETGRDLWKVERERLLAEARKKGTNKDSVRADLNALGGEPALPASPERTVTEPTLEGLTRLFQEGHPSLGIFSDEGGQFLGGHAMNADNRQKTLTALNGIWGEGTIRRTRKGDGSLVLYGRRLAMHLMVQPVVSEAFLADSLAGGTGFLPRFLICEPPSAIGTRLHSGTRRDLGAIEAFGERVERLLRHPPEMDPDTRELKPRLLPLSQEARALLIAYSDTIELQQAPRGTLAHVTGHASKSAEQAARIAGVLTIFSDLEAEEVPAETMTQAIELAQFYLSEARRLADGATISNETRKAEALRTWLLDGWQHRDVTAREVAQYGPNPLRETAKARAALQRLEQHGWVMPLEKGTVIRGAPRKEAWRIVSETGHVV